MEKSQNTTPAIQQCLDDVKPNKKKTENDYNLLNEKIEKQIERTRSEESSPKNTTLHFGLLLETKDLVDATMNLLEEYHNSFDSSIEPATISVSKEN